MYRVRNSKYATHIGWALPSPFIKRGFPTTYYPGQNVYKPSSQRTFTIISRHTSNSSSSRVSSSFPFSDSATVSSSKMTEHAVEYSPEALPEKPTDIQLGFETVPEIPSPISLPVSGVLPSYLSGVLFRNGPGVYEMPHSDGSISKMKHWFDGVGTAHRFAIDPERNTVTYLSRHTMQRVLDSAAENSQSSFKMYTFGVQDPCKGLLGRLFQTWRPFSVIPGTKKPVSNVNVTLENIPGVSRLVSRTDGNNAAVLNEESLELEREFEFRELNPALKGATCAHGLTDKETGEYFNFTYDFTFGPVEYNVFKTDKNGQTKILGKFKDKPRYVHSFALTKKYVVMLLFPCALNVMQLAFGTEYARALSFDKTSRTPIYVISREEARVVAKYEAEPGFCFHTISAYDDEAGDSIQIDLSRYATSNIVHELYVQNLVSKASDFFTAGKPCRFVLGNLKASLEAYSNNVNVPPPTAEERFHSHDSFELPQVNPNYALREHRFAYGVAHKEDDKNGTLFSHVAKLDVKTGETKWWGPPRCSVGEPIFVPDPNGEAEDDGVCLTVVLDPVQKKSFLAVIDARNMIEVARATVPQPVPFGFHGTYLE